MPTVRDDAIQEEVIRMPMGMNLYAMTAREIFGDSYYLIHNYGVSHPMIGPVQYNVSLTCLSQEQMDDIVQTVRSWSNRTDMR
jgi:hypothetical protein